MPKNIEDYSFTELMSITKKYIDVYKNGSESDFLLFKQQYPEVFTNRFHEIIGEFLNAFGISDSLLDQIKNNVNIGISLSNVSIKQNPTVH